MAILVRRLNSSRDKTFGRGLANYASGAEGTAQRVVSRLWLILGEWFTDTSDGVPWVQPEGSDVKGILGTKPPNLPSVEATLKSRITETTGVLKMLSFSLKYDSSKRTATVATKIQDVDGDIQNITVTVP